MMHTGKFHSDNVEITELAEKANGYPAFAVGVRVTPKKTAPLGTLRYERKSTKGSQRAYVFIPDRSYTEAIDTDTMTTIAHFADRQDDRVRKAPKKLARV